MADHCFRNPRQVDRYASKGRIAAVALAAANAAKSVAQSFPHATSPEPDSAGLLTRVTEMGIGAAAVAGLAYCAYLVRRRLDSIREREAMEEARMEAELRLLEKHAGATSGDTMPWSISDRTAKPYLSNLWRPSLPGCFPGTCGEGRVSRA